MLQSPLRPKNHSIGTLTEVTDDLSSLQVVYVASRLVATGIPNAVHCKQALFASALLLSFGYMY